MMFPTSYLQCELLYSRKLSQIGEKYDFHEENFHRLLTFAMPKDAMPPNLMEKTFASSHKTPKFTKVFSLESFPQRTLSLLITYHVYSVNYLVCLLITY